jgi:hypothetical protein
MQIEPPTPEPQPTAQGCILGILAVVVMVALFCFAVGATLVTVKWALGK